MSNLRAFVDGKQHLKSIDAQRQMIGNQQRVLVPSTKFNRAVPSSLDHKTSTSSRQVAHSTRKRKLDGGPQPSGFDTDAESLDDTTTMDVSEKRSRDSVDNFGANERFRRPELEANGSENNDRPFSDSGDGDEDSYAVTHLISDFDSEEFANFKKDNRLDPYFVQNVQISLIPAPGTGITASSGNPARTGRLARLSSFKVLSPAHPHTTSILDAKLQCNDVPKIEYPSLIAKSFGVPLASTDSAHLHFDHAADPSLHRMGADRASSGTAEPAVANKQQGHKKASNRRASPLLYDHSFSSSEHSEGGDMQKSTTSNPNQDSLRRSPSLDHDLDQLTIMTFQQLQDERFDHDLARDTSVISPDFAKASLYAKLEELCSVRDLRDQDGQQQNFFDNLSIDQYGESGKIIGEKLAGLIARMSSIRNQKRKITAEFESEIAMRERQIRAKAAMLKKEKVAMMRQTEEITTGRPV